MLQFNVSDFWFSIVCELGFMQDDSTHKHKPVVFAHSLK